ncbi:unnamed protein product (macronuclear) [Paramecium tetraurelia]|uniref:Transmembrane protein n=1 Tax=Paramecium tetraurelia TaxID=5888 RepID=A0DRS6_PARTE|nr:uncharacterized protein GSPATT00019461001 [Paramecium tetraurelia]CAK85743.1 unnamed protein product [Paramecium tetraurelia]|eukprot:XP_001453140.1 hypothetical protein (macronuclear) [Paramecium tetraurelia strain d4-2]
MISIQVVSPKLKNTNHKANFSQPSITKYNNLKSFNEYFRSQQINEKFLGIIKGLALLIVNIKQILVYLRTFQAAQREFQYNHLPYAFQIQNPRVQVEKQNKYNSHNEFKFLNKKKPEIFKETKTQARFRLNIFLIIRFQKQV